MLAKEPTQESIDELVSFLRAYGSSDGFKELQAMRQDNANLRRNVERLEVTYNTNLSTLAKNENGLQAEKSRHERELKVERDRLKQALQDNNSVQEQLRDKQSDLIKQTNDIEKHEKRIQSLINQVKSKDTKLQALEGVKTDRDHLDSELKSTKEDLKKKTGELTNALESTNILQSFIVKLEAIQDQKARM